MSPDNTLGLDVKTRVTLWQIIDIIQYNTEIFQNDELRQGLTNSIHITVNATTIGRIMNVANCISHLEVDLTF